MTYITDTHALVWYFTNDSRLGKTAFSALEGSLNKNTIIVPTIVLAEIMYISKKGRVLPGFKETVKKIEENSDYKIVSLDLDILIKADEFDNDLEMHDRLIVSTAIYYNCALITKDEKIIKSQLVKTIW